MKHYRPEAIFSVFSISRRVDVVNIIGCKIVFVGACSEKMSESKAKFVRNIRLSASAHRFSAVRCRGNPLYQKSTPARRYFCFFLVLIIRRKSDILSGIVVRWQNVLQATQ